MKKKLVSMFLGVTVALLAVPICTISTVSAKLIEAVSTNKPPIESLDKRIEEFKFFLNRVKNNHSVFSSVKATEICEEMKNILEQESPLVKVQGDTMIVGDTHSNGKMVENCCERFLEELKNGKSIIFLGDYVDRGTNLPSGPNAINNIMLIFKLKTMFPDKVVLLRGNHEEREMNTTYGFLAECKKKFLRGTDMQMFDNINNTFEYLPLAAVVNNNTFCVHGGISSVLKSLNQISQIPKPISSYDIYHNKLIHNLLWNDPSEEEENYGQNLQRGKNSMAEVYGKRAVDKFLKKNKLKRIIRAHECVEFGYQDEFDNGSVFTVFSSPNYEGATNYGAIIHIGKDIRSFGCELFK